MPVRSLRHEKHLYLLEYYTVQNGIGIVLIDNSALFESMKDAIEAWIDKSTNHERTKSIPLDNFEKFFTLFAEHNSRLSAEEVLVLDQEREMVWTYH